MSAPAAADPRRTLAPFGRRALEVVEHEALGPYRRLVCADPGPLPRPGQFYMLTAGRLWGTGEGERPYLPRALSFLRAAPGRLEFLLEDVGPGTRRLAALAPGDVVLALGPLGRGFAPPSAGRRPVLVGGGIGVAPLVALHDERPGRVLLGFRDAAHAQPAVGLLPDAALATDDGSRGHHGYVTELLAAALDADGDLEVHACGPAPMLEAVRRLCVAREVPGQLALESGMACGFGACWGCVVPLRAGGYTRLCVEGPVLAADAVAEVPAELGFAPEAAPG